MVKKILLGVVLVMLIGILVYGAYLRSSEINGGILENNRNSSGRGRNAQNENGQVIVETRDWVTLSGQVSGVDVAGLTVITADGKNLIVTGRPWLFIKEQMPVKIGDELEIKGFYEGDAFEVGKITVKSTGQVIAVRDESGYPLWSGRIRSW